MAAMNISSTLQVTNLLAVGLLAAWNIGFDKKTEAPWISLDEYQKAHPSERDKRVPVVAVINTVDTTASVSGKVDIGTLPGVEISSPVQIDSRTPVRVEAANLDGLPVHLQKITIGSFEAVPAYLLKKLPDGSLEY